MNALGLCKHNNYESSCPTCIHGKTMGYDCNCGPMSGDCGCGPMSGMGATNNQCEPGFYPAKMFGMVQCLPKGGTLLSSAGQSLASTILTGVVGTPQNIALAQEKAAAIGGQKAFEFIKRNKVPLGIGVAVIALGFLYGTGKFLFGR